MYLCVHFSKKDSFMKFIHILFADYYLLNSGVVINIKGGLSGLTQATHSAAE